MPCHFPLDGVGFTGPVVHSTRPKAVYERRVLCLGCSFTAGHGSASKLHAYPELLSAALPQHDFWNCGISGVGTYVHLTRAGLYKSVRPDLAILQIMDSFRSPTTFLSEREADDLLGGVGPLGVEETVDGWDYWRKSRPYRRAWNRPPGGKDAFQTLPKFMRQTLRNSSLRQDRIYVAKLAAALGCPFVLFANSTGYPSTGVSWYAEYGDCSAKLREVYGDIPGCELVVMSHPINPAHVPVQGYHPSRAWHAEAAELLKRRVS